MVWIDGSGTIYKGTDTLGRSAQRFELVRYTGDVVWRDHYGALYKNETLLGRNCSEFKVEDDGRVLWRDSYGKYHIG